MHYPDHGAAYEDDQNLVDARDVPREEMVILIEEQVYLSMMQVMTGEKLQLEVVWDHSDYTSKIPKYVMYIKAQMIISSALGTRYVF